MLPGVVVKVVHVLFVFIHERRHVVELHLQVHHLKEIHTDVVLAVFVRTRSLLLKEISGSPAG